MKSPIGGAAAAVFLAALPLTLAYQLAVGAGAEVVIHFALAAGAGLMSLAVFDFRTPKWMAWMGCASIGALAVIFLLQAAAELMANARLSDLVYRTLGQRVEGWLVDLFLLWCAVVVFVDSAGKTRVLGFTAVAIAISVEAYANGLSYFGSSLNAAAPALKLAALLPFVWLLLESRKTRQS